MESTLSLLADAANHEQSGKLNVLGVFDQIYADKFPYAHPQMFVVVRLSAGPAEFGSKKNIEVCLLDPEGKVIGGRLTAKGEVPRPDNAMHANLELILRLVNVPFHKPGPYAIAVLVSGEQKASISLEVVERKATSRRKKSG